VSSKRKEGGNNERAIVSIPLAHRGYSLRLLGVGRRRDSDGDQRSHGCGGGDKVEKSASHSLLHLNFGTATEPRLRAVRFLAVL
jgi:hypothetical protein